MPVRRPVFSSSWDAIPKGRLQAPLIAQAAVQSLLAVLFPSDCRLCLQPLAHFSRLPVCSNCLQSLVPIRAVRCQQCSLPLPAGASDAGEVRCRGCRVYEPEFTRAASFGAYQDALRGVIHLLKYQRLREAARPLARLAAEAALQLEGEIDDDEAIFIPVPAYQVVQRERGFNQAELIARAAHKGIEESLRKKLRLETAVLRRVRFDASQVARHRRERWVQIRDSFAVTSAATVRGREVLLIDDVMTTGATASECSRQLRLAGAKNVWVITVARTLEKQQLDRGNQQPDQYQNAVTAAAQRVFAEDHSHGHS